MKYLIDPIQHADGVTAQEIGSIVRVHGRHFMALLEDSLARIRKTNETTADETAFRQNQGAGQLLEELLSTAAKVSGDPQRPFAL